MSATKRETRAQARDRLAAERAAAAAAERRRQLLLRVVLGVVVLAVVVGVGFAVVASRAPKVDASAPNPAGVTATKGYPTGTAAAPILDIYEDFQCPNCRDFEAAAGARIQALATDGKAKVVYHTLTFLDAGNEGKTTPDRLKSSTRAANAAACAQDQGTFLAYHDQLYTHQPSPEGKGWTDAELQGYAAAAGITDTATFDACVSSQKYVGFLTQVTAEADSRQVTATPTFFVDGKLVTPAGGSWADVGNQLVTEVTKAAG